MNDFSRQWHITDDPMWDGYSVYVICDNKKRHVTKIEMTIEDRTPNAYTSPAMVLEPNEAQQIMNELWKVGLRPKDGEGSSAQINSMKEHLADMRKIAFKKLGIN